MLCNKVTFASLVLRFDFQSFHAIFCLFQKLAKLLFEAASDCSYVDPQKIEEVLGISQDKTRAVPHSTPEITGRWTLVSSK